ncbi:DUF3891 family protein [Mucilaginibacter sp. BJC16-A38]|uniref:DUF3891 family protein n=1 Tax=Mucilaginibacter phenanthrenivorans TaxID=1234842 RepID=UPI0021588E9A|nr:DUF3891 family protein [Mucilaginibacter phenanthrenivorans]MCR8557333.1 DUF3891 family protein [Mucilaginibacter phenanthrenivorans]
MIVNYTEKGWEIITQRAHGTLAGLLAMHWKHSVRTARWFETLIAIAGHDDARIEPRDAGLLSTQGGPLDFTMTTYDHEHCISTYEGALAKSRYIALLTSLHLEFVYGELAAGSEAGLRFMQDQSALREKWMKELQISTDQTAKDYRLLEWCDALSLLICKRKSQPEGRAIEISKGPDGISHQLTIDLTGDMYVTPWPFEAEQFEVQVESRVLEQLSFRDHAEFRAAFDAAGVICNAWTLKKQI